MAEKKNAYERIFDICMYEIEDVLECYVERCKINEGVSDDIYADIAEIIRYAILDAASEGRKENENEQD